MLTCCFILHVPISGSRELQTDYYSKLYLEAAKILSNTELPIEVDLLVSAVYHFNSCFDDSFLHKYLKRNLSRIIASLNDLDYSLLIPFVDLVVTTIFSDVELHVPKSPKDCPFCISYCSRKSEFSILIDKIECVNDPIEHLNKTSLRNESLLWQIVTNEVSTAKEDLRFSERLGHSSTLIFVEELENCITNSRPTYLNVKLVYFISEILRILACRLNSSNVTLLQLKQIAQNLFLDAVVSFDSFVSPACSNSNDLYDIVFFAKSTATILSTDSILDWSAELVERIELLLKRALQVSNDFTSTLANDEVFSRTDFLCPSKKRRISSTKSFDLFYENADQGK